MKHLEFLFQQLPQEMVNKILFEFKGITHPHALIIKKYWDELDDNYNIFIEIKLRAIDGFELDDFELIDRHVEVVNLLDYPRIFFPVEIDIVEIYDE